MVKFPETATPANSTIGASFTGSISTAKFVDTIFPFELPVTVTVTAPVSPSKLKVNILSEYILPE